jgi:hypothetical protein
VKATPKGTILTIWPRVGVRIPDSLGLAIERGDYGAIAANPKWMRLITSRGKLAGAASYFPGAEVPNYTLKAPSLLRIMRASTTVEDAAYLSELLKADMGLREWAACTWIKK